MNNIFKKKLGTIYIDIPDFYAIFFGDVANFETYPRLFLKNAEKIIIHFIIKRINGINSLKI
jgi:hypothetical protein